MHWVAPAAAALSLVLAGCGAAAAAGQPDCGEKTRVVDCIRQFSAEEWRGCESDGRVECSCNNDDGINWCCGSPDQAEAIRIWQDACPEAVDPAPAPTPAAAPPTPAPKLGPPPSPPADGCAEWCPTDDPGSQACRQAPECQGCDCA